MKDFVASLFLGLIVGVVALAILSANGNAPVRVEIEIGSVQTAQATAVPPTPTAEATAVAQIFTPAPAISIEPLTGAEMYERTGYWIYATPYQLHGSRLSYCHDPEWPWTDEERAISAAAFAAWEPAGLSFHEVAYSPYAAECFLLVSAGSNAHEVALGIASSIGPLLEMQNWIWSNTYPMPHNLYVVIHEIGHVLGLAHTSEGVMQPHVQLGVLPNQTEFAAVRRFWFGEE
jgi:hypothetical protein